MRADLDDQHVPDVQFRGDAKQNGRNANRVGVGQLGEIAGTHQNFSVGALAAHLRVTLERGHEAKMDGIEHGVDQIAPPLGVKRIHGAVERGHVAVILGDQHRRRGDLVGDP